MCSPGRVSLEGEGKSCPDLAGEGCEKLQDTSAGSGRRSFVCGGPILCRRSVSVEVGIAPDCPYGYFDYAPYHCVPDGYYGSQWFNGGVFVGAGPWFHGSKDFRGDVDNSFDPQHGYIGAMPRRGDKASANRRDPKRSRAMKPATDTATQAETKRLVNPARCTRSRPSQRRTWDRSAAKLKFFPARPAPRPPPGGGSVTPCRSAPGHPLPTALHSDLKLMRYHRPTGSLNFRSVLHISLKGFPVKCTFCGFRILTSPSAKRVLSRMRLRYLPENIR